MTFGRSYLRYTFRFQVAAPFQIAACHQGLLAGISIFKATPEPRPHVFHFSSYMTSKFSHISTSVAITTTPLCADESALIVRPADTSPHSGVYVMGALPARGAEYRTGTHARPISSAWMLTSMARLLHQRQLQIAVAVSARRVRYVCELGLCTGYIDLLTFSCCCLLLSRY